jgi:hypothetical protein
MRTTTISKLRPVLAEDFPQSRTTLLRLHEAGVVPKGRAGRDGIGSAVVDQRTLALILIALAVPGFTPIEAPAAAQEYAGWRLRFEETGHVPVDDPRAGLHLQPLFRRHVDDLRTVLDVLTDALDADAPPTTWHFDEFEVVCAGIPRLIFTPDEVAVFSGGARVLHRTIVPASVVRAIAELLA